MNTRPVDDSASTASRPERPTIDPEPFRTAGTGNGTRSTPTSSSSQGSTHPQTCGKVELFHQTLNEDAALDACDTFA